MSKVRADKLVNRAGTGAVELTEGSTIPSGKYISGAGNINITGMANVTGVSTFSGNVTIGGTLTYDDVTNIDSVGIITAQSGIIVSANGINAVGLVTATGFSGNVVSTAATVGLVTATGTVVKVGTALTAYHDTIAFAGLLKENVKITAGKLSANSVINLDNGMVHYFTTQETTTTTPNIISGTGINTDMSIGDTLTLSVITTAAAAGYSAQWRVDGVEASAGVTTYWNGGSAPSAGGSSGIDFYTLNLVKTANARFTAFANVSNFA